MYKISAKFLHRNFTADDLKPLNTKVKFQKSSGTVPVKLKVLYILAIHPAYYSDFNVIKIMKLLIFFLYLILFNYYIFLLLPYLFYF